MDKMKVSGLIVGIIGLAVLFFWLIIDLVAAYDTTTYERWENSIFSTSAILLSVAFTLGATAMISYKEKRGAYFMALSTIIATMGLVPAFVRMSKEGLLESQGQILFSAVFALTMILPMLVSTILFAIPRKQQP